MVSIAVGRDRYCIRSGQTPIRAGPRYIISRAVHLDRARRVLVPPGDAKLGPDGEGIAIRARCPKFRRAEFAERVITAARALESLYDSGRAASKRIAIAVVVRCRIRWRRADKHYGR